jgi:hypothetical protein
MTSRMVGSVLTLVILLLSAGGGAAQTYTQMQWGMNKGVTPYAFGANINGTWRDLGTVSAAGAWTLSPTNVNPTTLTVSGASTFNGKATFNESIIGLKSVSAAGTFGIDSAFYINSQYIGTGSNPFSFIGITDSATNNVAGSWLSGQWISHIVGPGAGAGSRTTHLPMLTISNPIPCTIGAACFQTASFPQAYVSANLGGTAITSMGDVYGAGVIAEAQSGATYLHGLIGQETDVSARAGSSLEYKAIAGFISVNGDAVGGSIYNAMVFLAADQTTTYKWPKGFTFGNPVALWPFDTSSNLIDATAPAFGAMVANNGVDFSLVTFSGCAFKSTGFCVNPTGSVATTSITSTGTKPTATGSGGTCAAGTVTGGATVGAVALTAACASTDTLALTNMPAVPNGYVCDAADRTSGVLNLVQTATTTTGATFTFNATTGATDVIQFKCIGY